MKWLILSLLFAKFALAEESMLMDKKSIINQINTYSQTQNGKEISSGQKIKSSEKFLALYNRILSGDNHNGKGKYLAIVNSMIKYAKQYESGEISKDEFDMQIRESIAKSQEVYDSNQSKNYSFSDFKAISESFNFNNNAQNTRGAINCITNKVGDTTYTNCQ